MFYRNVDQLETMQQKISYLMMTIDEVDEQRLNQYFISKFDDVALAETDTSIQQISTKHDQENQKISVKNSSIIKKQPKYNQQGYQNTLNTPSKINQQEKQQYYKHHHNRQINKSDSASSLQQGSYSILQNYPATSPNFRKRNDTQESPINLSGSLYSNFAELQRSRNRQSELSRTQSLLQSQQVKRQLKQLKMKKKLIEIQNKIGSKKLYDQQLAYDNKLTKNNPTNNKQTSQQQLFSFRPEHVIDKTYKKSQNNNKNKQLNTFQRNLQGVKLNKDLKARNIQSFTEGNWQQQEIVRRLNNFGQKENGKYQLQTEILSLDGKQDQLKDFKYASNYIHLTYGHKNTSSVLSMSKAQILQRKIQKLRLQRFLLKKQSESNVHQCPQSQEQKSEYPQNQSNTQDQAVKKPQNRSQLKYICYSDSQSMQSNQNLRENQENEQKSHNQPYFTKNRPPFKNFSQMITLPQQKKQNKDNQRGILNDKSQGHSKTKSNQKRSPSSKNRQANGLSKASRHTKNIKQAVHKDYQTSITSQKIQDQLIFRVNSSLSLIPVIPYSNQKTNQQHLVQRNRVQQNRGKQVNKKIVNASRQSKKIEAEY